MARISAAVLAKRRGFLAEWAKRNRLTVVSADLSRNRSSIVVECKDGHRWQTTWLGITVFSHACPECTGDRGSYGRIRFVASRMREIASGAGVEVLSPLAREYRGRQKIRVRCGCGRVSTTTPADLAYKRKPCRVCAKNERRKKQEESARRLAEGDESCSFYPLDDILRVLRRIEPMDERELLIFRLHSSGITYDECSRLVGVHRTRVQAIDMRFRRKLRVVLSKWLLRNEFLEANFIAEKSSFVPPAPADACVMAESASVDILPLSVRTRNCLRSVNITTVGELFCLAALPENGHGFRWVRNFGAKCLHEIRQAVSQYSPRMAIELNVVLERRSKGEMTGGCDSAVNPSEGG